MNAEQDTIIGGEVGRKAKAHEGLLAIQRP